MCLIKRLAVVNDTVPGPFLALPGQANEVKVHGPSSASGRHKRACASI